MTSVQFYFLFPAYSCFTNWKKSFGCHPLSKNYQHSFQTIESYLFTLLLLSMPLSWSNFSSYMTSLYLSYQFNNYTIYTTIIIAYILPCIRTSDSDNRYSKICAWIVDGHSNEFVYSMQSQK